MFIQQVTSLSSLDTPNALTPAPAAIVLFQPDAAMLEALLVALAQGGRRLFIFVNGPVELAVEHMIGALANCRIIRSSDNIGLGAGMNALANLALGEGFTFLLIFDQDSAPEPQLPAALAAHFSRLVADGLRPAAVGPLLVARPCENYRPIRYSWRDRTRGTVDFLPTSGSLISLAAWRATGPFRDDYFIGGIDVEWGFRAWHHGFSSVVARDVQMVHRWGTAAAEKDRWRPQILRQSDVRNYFYLRNAVDCLLLPHIPLTWKAQFAPTLVAQIALLLANGGGSSSKRRVVGQALSDGWNGKLGPLPRTFPAGQ